MLSEILKKSDCASCKFCCSFRRSSLWETPVFDSDTKEKISRIYPEVKFKKAGKESFTYDIKDSYKTDDPNEEAACPFLNRDSGCVLDSDLKPFDCSIWPLRAVVDEKERIFLALTPTCPSVNKVPFEKVEAFVRKGLGEKIISYAKEHPDIIKEKTEFLSQEIKLN